MSAILVSNLIGDLQTYVGCHLNSIRLNQGLMGLATNLAFYGLAAIAHNIQKGAKFLLLYGLLDAEQTG